MLLIPAKDELLVFSLTKEQVQDRLIEELAQSASEKGFIGWLEGENFQISRKLSRPDNFSPLLKGIIDSTSKGSIIFMNYRLMFSTRMFLIFWSVILLLLSLFFILKYNAYLYGAIAFGVGVFNYVIVYFNFKKQIRISREQFINMMNSNQ